jgi:hypothetical protein
MAEPETGKPDGDRRGFLRSAAGATAAVAAVAAASTSEAQQRPGRLPLNTPVTQLGFSPPEIAMLTPAAQKLNKGDLMQLQEWAANGDMKDAPVHLTIQDLTSLQAAYRAMETRQHAAKQSGVLEHSVSCCCCTPCCSCCAVADHA